MQEDKIAWCPSCKEGMMAYWNNILKNWIYKCDSCNKLFRFYELFAHKGGN